MSAPHFRSRLTSWPVMDYREHVQDMKPLEAVDYLLDLLDFFVAAPDADIAWTWPGAHLTPAQKRVVRALAQFGGLQGGAVTRDQIMSVVYGSRNHDDWPDAKIISVHLYRLRPILAEAGIEVAGVWGMGWRITVPDGFVWPWEVRA